jgi:hypothetical protein
VTAGHGEASTPGHSAASLEERAMLEALRARADRDGQEAAETLAELAGRLAEARDPKTISRVLAAQARRGRALAVRALREKITGKHRAADAARGARAKLAVSPGAKRAALAALPALGVLTMAVVARRQGWLAPNPPGRTDRSSRQRGWPAPGPGMRGGRGSRPRRLPARRASRV